VVTEPQHAIRFAERLVRLPLWPAMTDDEVDRVVSAVRAFGPAPAARTVPAAPAATASTGQDSRWA
jgi:dTDP-4-amino-4,6-dideoxygalactose transaminase